MFALVQSPVALLGAAAALLAAVWISTSLTAWYRLRHIKGPVAAGFSKLWLLRVLSGQTAHLDLYNVCEKYGTIARISPNGVITSDPELLRRVLGVRTKYKRSDWYDAMRLDPTENNVISTRDDGEHGRLRSKMAAGYSGKDGQSIEAKIDASVVALVNLIRSKYVSSDPAAKLMDFGPKASYFAMDVIVDITLGKPLGFLAADEDIGGFLRANVDNVPAMVALTQLPWLIKLMGSPLMKPLLPDPETLPGFGMIIGTVKRECKARWGSDKGTPPDMLGSFQKHGITQKEAETEAVVPIVAGSDPLATAIRATILHVVTSPRILSRLQAEIDQTGPSSPIQDAEARRMPYLQAVIKEGLRIHPPLTSLLSKEVPEGGDEWGGVFLPGGTSIGYCAWGIFRHEKTWGTDADVFRPERWLETPPERLRTMENAMELVFGLGRWKCLGQAIAAMALNKVFVELLRAFDFAIVDPTRPWKSVCAGVFFQSEMWVRVTERRPVVRR